MMGIGKPVVKVETMKTITLKIADERLLKLEATATNMGISVEELLLMGVEAVVNQPEVSFPNEMAYVFNKNTELYNRLQFCNSNGLERGKLKIF